jgi:hypothetical protein
VILVEAGTFVRNMDSMKKSKCEEALLSKYMNIINEIEDVHFEDDSVRADMLKGYKGAKKELSGPNLLWKLDAEMRDVRKFAAKFPRFSNPSELPSGMTQLRHMKKPVIIKLWKKKYPVMYILLICVLLHCQLTLMFAVYVQVVAFVDYNDNKLIWEQISSTWWLEHESCKYMLAILVHKDNKDISSNLTKLPPGDTQKEVRKKKADALAEEHVSARAMHPVSIYDNVDHKLKKAKVDGMRSQVEKNLVESIVS